MKLAARVCLFALCATALAAGGEPPPDPPPEPRKEPEQPIESETVEHVVVSASATGQDVLDAPAAVDVLEGETLAAHPGEQLADHLRRVPGINVVQFSARDVNLSSRSATGGINSSTLALVDGRTLYQDFLGFVMWEFAPTDMALVDRVEVVRGPASALWGANAVGGLVHVLTKSPRDTPGGRASLEAGSYDALRLELTQSFLAERWAVRASAGYAAADAFERPATIVNVFGETVDPDLGLVDSAPASATQQPRFDVRADWDGDDGTEWVLQAGSARTAGWIATGLGPFDIESSTSNSYLEARYRRGPFEFQADSSYFDGRGVNLINALPFDFTSTATQAQFRGHHVLGRRAVLGWGTELGRSSYDLSLAPNGDQRSRAGAYAEVDVVLAPRFKLVSALRADHIEETVGTVLSPRVALRFQPTPRHTLRVAWGQAFRSPSVVESDLLVPAIPVALLDWQAIDESVFGTPDGLFSLMADYACSQVPDHCGVPQGEIPSYVAVTAGEGSRDLEEERTSSIEIGYAAQLGPISLSATVYRTHTDGGIDFPVQATYGLGPDGAPRTDDDVLLPTDPDGDGIAEAPPVDVCVGLSEIRPFDELCELGPVPYHEALSILLDGRIPALFRYENRGRVENQGFELGFGWADRKGRSAYLNYSWQDVPRSEGRDMDDRIDTLRAETESAVDLDGDGLVGDTSPFVNIPAEHRLSLGGGIDAGRFFAFASCDFVDDTFWQDVLTPDFWGFVEDYTLVGVRGGWRWPARGLELRAQVTNLLDEELQQHIYGDIIDRRTTVGLGWSWPAPGRGRSRSCRLRAEAGAELENQGRRTGPQ